MEYMKVWDWRYKVIFDKNLETELVYFANKLTLSEKEIFLKTIEHFKSFFTFGMLLDYCTENPSKVDEIITYAKAQINKLLYAPKELTNYYLKKLNNSNLDKLNELQYFLNYATVSGKTLLDHSNFLKVLFGSYYDKISKSYLSAKDNKLLKHKDKLIKIDSPKELVNKYISKIEANTNVTQKFGGNIINDYDMEVKNESGYGEWWDKEVSDLQKSKLILYKNSFILKEFDFEYTMYHEIYPGHAHFYARTKQNRNKCFDNGSMFMLEGYATFVEWNSIKNAYTHNLKVEACKLLNLTLQSNFETAINTLINENALPKELFIEKLIRVSQYPLFQESYYLGALAIESMLKDNIFKNANDFLEFLNNNNCGDFFAVWIKDKKTS